MPGSFYGKISEPADGQTDNGRTLTLCHANFTPERYENDIREGNINIVGKSSGLEAIGVAADRNGPFGTVVFSAIGGAGFKSRPTS